MSLHSRQAILTPKIAPYFGPVTNVNTFPNARNTTASSSMMTEKEYVALDHLAITGLVATLCNFFVDTSSGFLGIERGCGNAIDVKLWLEFPAGTYTPILYNGSATITVPDASSLDCDPLYPGISRGTKFKVWTRVVGNGGSNYPYIAPDGTKASNPLDYLNGEACQFGTSGIPTTPGTITESSLGRRGYYPIFCGMTVRETVSAVSDSRGMGSDDTADSSRDLGNICRSLGANQRAYINGGISGDRVSSFLASHALRLPILRRSRTIILQVSGNAFIQHSATTDLPLRAYVQRLATLFPGKRILLATVEPQSTSTDAYATVGNQTTASTNAARVAYNGWVRGKTLGLEYVELADSVESARDSGKWIANYTDDGVHALQVGYLAQAASGAIVPNVIERYGVPAVAAPSIDMSLVTGTAASYSASKFGNGISGGFPYVAGITPGIPNFTLNFICKISAPLGAFAYLFHCGPIGAWMAATTGYVSTNDGSGTSTLGSPNTNVADGTDKEIEVSIDANGLVRLFVEGALVVSYTKSSWPTGNWSNEGQFMGFRFKANSGIATAASPLTGGVISDVGLFIGVRNTAAYTPRAAAFTGSESGLISYHSFNNTLAGIRGPAF